MSSVKVHHAPGGASSFSLGGDYGVDQREKVAAKPSSYNPIYQQSDERIAGKQGPAIERVDHLKMDV